MDWLDFLVLTLAASAVVDVWFNGSILAEALAYVQARTDLPLDSEDSEGLAEPPADQPGRLQRLADQCLPTVICQLLVCPFCLSHHTPWLLATACFVPGLFWDSPWALLCKLPVYCLAATRLGNLINGLLPSHLRYERFRE